MKRKGQIWITVICIMPVSYTHLDVYKRQTVDRVQILLGEPVKLKQKLALLSGIWTELTSQRQTAVSIDVRSGKEAIVRLK